MTEHTKLINEILLMLAAKYPGEVRAWSNKTGGLFDANGRLVKFGLPGSADILGIMKPGGFLAIEVKVGRDRQKPEQKSFNMMVTSFGGLYILARNLDDVEAAIERVRRPS